MKSIKKQVSLPKILFYAPVGNLIQSHMVGGAEAGCQKTIQILNKNGFEVILIEKPAKLNSSIRSTFELVFKLLKLWCGFFIMVIKNKPIAFHVAGFYLNQVYFEWLLIKTAQFLNVNTVYEIRNGGMIASYYNRSGLYRYFFKKIFINSTSILCQGLDYVDFLKEKFGISSIYYPNYLMDKFIKPNNVERASNNTIMLIFVGRIVPDKNIDFLLDICVKLKQISSNFFLNIFGGFDPCYYEKLCRMVDENDLHDNVSFMGRKPFNEIYNYLRNAHFFLFPSREKREGHSNALTEAMGCGVVPIVSSVGFNSSIVNDSRLVISNFDSDIYAKLIGEIWHRGEWLGLSEYVHNRVLNKYTEKLVSQSLINMYRSFIKL